MFSCRRVLRAFSQLLLAAAAAAPPPAAAATWWRLPIWGADVRVFATDPFVPGSLFCGTSRGNIYGSSDGGASWAPLRQGPAFPGYVVTALIGDPKTPGRLWAALAGQYAGGLVVRSDNRGADWTILASWKVTVATRALALVPGEPALLAVGGDDGVRLSRDGGETWLRTGADTQGLQQVESLAFDPADPRVLYAGTWRQAFRTRDGGATWSRIAEGMVLDATIYSWDFGPDPRDIWVSTCGWVYHTKDGGDHWTRFKGGFTNRRSQAIRRDPRRPGVIYAATVGGLHRSTDGGENWSRISRESLVVTALEIDRGTGRLYVGTEGEGVFITDDAGATLNHGSVGLTEGRVSDLVLDPNDPGRLFFFRAYGGDESGVWEARGLKVRRVSRDPLPPAASLVTFRDPAGKTVLALFSSFSGLLFSRDLGERWIAPANPPAGVPIALFASPFSSPVLVTTSGVFQVTGAGDAFLPMGGPATPASAELLSDPAGSPLLEIRSGEGVFRWDGQGWSSHRIGILKGGIFQEGAGSAGSYTSLQEVGGKLIWEEGGRRLSVSSPRVGLALATAAAGPGGRLYVGTTGDGLFLFEP